MGKIRLQKYMSECGIASRRKSEEFIKNGKVFVNGCQIKELGTKVNSKDEIIVEGKLLSKENKEYYLLYKPRKTISSVSDDKKRTTVLDLIDSKVKLFPVGRLDYDTSGVLILTNDGELSNYLTHPKNKIKRVYEVKIDGLIKIDEIKALENGIYIDNVKAKNCKVKLKKVDKQYKRSYLIVTLEEGRNHEIKNMFGHFGYNVVKLKRIKYDFLTLEGLKEGQYRKLAKNEVLKLKKDLYEASPK